MPLPSKRERECIRRALEVYHIRVTTGSLPTTHRSDRKLRHFLDNYKNVCRGKRTGATYASVNAVLRRCVPNFDACFEEREGGQRVASGCGPPYGESTRSASAGRDGATVSHLRREMMDAQRLERLYTWCECFRCFGRWPSLACYRDNQSRWEMNPILSRTTPEQVVNSFKNYKQTVHRNGSGTLEDRVVTEQLRKMDPTIFARRYQKSMAANREADVASDTAADEPLPKCIQHLPNVV